MNYFEQEDKDYYSLVVKTAIVFFTIGLILTILEI